MSEGDLNTNLYEPRPALGVYELVDGWMAPDKSVHTTALVREAAGEEEDLLNGTGDSLTRILQIVANCVESIGGHKIAGNVLALRRMSELDRMVLLIAVRRQSFGDSYEFTVECPRCKTKERYIANLATLETKRGPLPPGTTTFEFTTSRGMRVVASTATVEVVGVAQALVLQMGEAHKLSAHMLSRLVSIDGEPVVTDMSKPKEVADWIERIVKMSMVERQEIRKAMEANEGDIDLTMEITCGKGDLVKLGKQGRACGLEYATEIPVGDPRFFSP